MSSYFIYGSLPLIEFGSKPDISIKGLSRLFKMNLTGRERRKVDVFALWIDINNLHRMFAEKELDPKGRYTETLIAASLEDRIGLPEYVYEFVETYDSDDERVKNFPLLLAKYFSTEVKNLSGILKSFFKFEHEWRILITAYRAKRMGRDMGRELQFEDMSNPIVEMALAQKDAQGKLIFPYEYRELESALEKVGPNPLKQYELIAKYRFDYYTEYFVNHPFTLIGIIAYMMRLWVLEDFYSLRQDEGDKILNHLMENIDG